VARSFLPHPQIDHRDVIRRDTLLAGLRYELPQQLLSFGPVSRDGVRVRESGNHQ
jgi:hypothetical protein